MKIVRELESLLEKYIDGFFNKKFSSDIQPVEIAPLLVREMEKQQVVGVNKIYVPNNYTVYLNEASFTKLAAYRQTICNDLVTYLSQAAKNRNYTLVGRTVVDICAGENINKLTEVRVESRFTEPVPDQEPDDEQPASSNPEPEHTKFGHTRVFQRILPDAQQRMALAGRLTIVEGVNTGDTVEVAAARVNIGRRESNELPLTDINTSRLQAYVIWEDNKHVLYDAQSLNGTYVNNIRITRKELRDGDHIVMGNTVILYEVK